MARLSMPVPEKYGSVTLKEIYILSRTNDINNTKIRDGKMDIKTFVQSKDGLEQWNPLMKANSMKASVLKEVFPFQGRNAKLDEGCLYLRRIYGYH